MGGSWIVVGACLLGVVSIVLIAGSLWASSSARKRPRPAPLVSGSYPPIAQSFAAPPTTDHTMITAPPTAGQTVITAPPSPFSPPSHEPPVDQATQFLTVDDIFALADDRVEPTRILDPEELLGHDAPPVEPVPPPAIAPRPVVVWSPATAIPAIQTPAASIPRPQNGVASKPAPAPAPRPFAPPDPAAFVKPPVETPQTPYVGFVAPRGPGREDDDDDDDDEDPETELVHQAELLALMMKSRPPG